jgi:hypothetical protein
MEEHMPIATPAECRDHAADWIDYFYRRRGAEIAAMIDDDLVAEHERNPLQAEGHHSTTLHLVLNYFRNAPIIGKEFVYAVRPYEEYKVGVVTGRGEPAAMLDDRTFATEEEAVHAVFLRRVEKLRGSLEAPADKGDDR